MARKVKGQTRRPLQQLSYADIDEVFVVLAETARREGILHLERLVQGDDEDYLNYGMRLAIDGTEPDLIMAIQSGDNPKIVDSKLKRLF